MPVLPANAVAALKLGPEKTTAGSLAYFGIVKSLLLQSPGIIYRSEFIRNLHVIYGLCKETLCNDLLRLIGMKDDSIFKSSHNVPKTTQITLDFFCDGVSIFKNSVSGSILPLMCRIYSIGKFIIPVDYSTPFVVAVFHGPDSKPDVHQYFEDFIKELQDGKNAISGLILRLRYFIGDTPMRAMVKGELRNISLLNIFIFISIFLFISGIFALQEQRDHQVILHVKGA